MTQHEVNIAVLVRQANRTIGYRSLGALFGVSAQTVWRWAHNKKRPSPERLKKIMPILEDILNLNGDLPLIDDPKNHTGPPDNEFSWRPTDPPMLKKALNLLIRYGDLLQITNKPLLDTAAKYIREVYSKYRVGKTHLDMLALAALKVASLKFLKNVDVSAFITDEELFEKYWYVISQHLYRE